MLWSRLGQRETEVARQGWDVRKRYEIGLSAIGHFYIKTEWENLGRDCGVWSRNYMGRSRMGWTARMGWDRIR